ncbi:hypothetical protein [Hyphomicrobium sp.]|uniref:hypothetical protein n=1 Tax=Hyphomicrobium sp. TaxID=82 RepID=UPI003F71FF13
MMKQDESEQFLAWNDLSPRARAVWPASEKGYLRDQHTLEISLDTELAWWIMANVVGRTSFTHDLEETIVTALRVISGDLPVSQIEEMKRLGKAVDAARQRANP